MKHPTFVNCPEDITFTIGTDGDCENGVIWSIPIAEDNCEVSVTQTAGPVLGAQLDTGTYEIVYTAADNAGNEVTCSFTVRVVDDVNPLLVCPEDLTISADENACTWASSAGELDPLLSVDNCPDYTLTYAITVRPHRWVLVVWQKPRSSS